MSDTSLTPKIRMQNKGKINLEEFFSKDTKIKYACVRQAVALSMENPAELYSDIDFFVKLWKSSNNVFRWVSIQIVGNLSRVDKKKKIDKLLPKFISFLKSGELITANNAILALTEIGRNKPKHLDKIIKEILKIEDYKFSTLECRNIAIGKTLFALDQLKNQTKNQREIISFVKRQTKNPRSATRKKAQDLLKKISKVAKQV